MTSKIKSLHCSNFGYVIVLFLWMSLYSLEITAQARALSFTPQLLCKDNNEACAIADVNQDGQLVLNSSTIFKRIGNNL